MAWWNRKAAVAKAADSERKAAQESSDHSLGDVITSCVEKGALPRALAIVDERISDKPSASELYVHRGRVLLAWRRFPEARSSFQVAERAGITSRELHMPAGWSAYFAGDMASAKQHFSNALANRGNDPEANFALAVAHMGDAEHAQALSCFTEALRLDPDYPDCWLNIASCRLALGDLVEGEDAARRAVAAGSHDARAWVALGVILGNQDRVDECLRVLRQARDLEIAAHEHAGATAALAARLMYFDRADEACELCAATLPSYPGRDLQSVFAVALLKTGRLSRGWDQYECRWLSEHMATHRERFPQPRWEGQALANKTILIRMEQGLGDGIQFARYAIVLKRLGARVVLQPFDSLTEIGRRFQGVDQAVGKGREFVEFDYHAPLLSLPRLLGEEAGYDVPVPYLRVGDEVVRSWDEVVAPTVRRVGVVWAGNPQHAHDRHRSIPLPLFSGLFATPGVQFVSLQKNLRAGESEILDSFAQVENQGPRFESFLDTATTVAQLDLVICVDTAIAHLAGALGKPTWLLLPTGADFRWRESGDTTAWYPTMRLFRQDQLNRWAPVLDRVKAQLASWISTESSVPNIAHAPVSLTVPLPIPERGAIPVVRETRHGFLQYLPDRDEVGRSIDAYGEYMEAQLALIARIVPDDAHVIEAGAGIGAHTIWLAQALSPDALVLAYESDPVLDQILRTNLVANGLLARVTLPRGRIDRGAASPDNDSGSAGSIDDLQLLRLDMLKVGVSAFALPVVQGAIGTLLRLRPRVFAATNPEGLESLVSVLWDAGYRCWQIELPRFSPANYYGKVNHSSNGDKSLAVLALPEESPVELDLGDCEIVRSRTLADD